MAKLYEITNDLLSVFKELELCEDAVPPHIMDRLKGLERDLEQKLAGCCTVRSEAISEADMLDAEITRLQKRKAACDRRVKFIESYIQDSLMQIGESSMDVANKWTIRIQSTNPAVNIYDEAAVPAGFKSTETVTKILKGEIAKAIKDGKDVPGCCLVSGKAVRIY